MSSKSWTLSKACVANLNYKGQIEKILNLISSDQWKSMDQYLTKLGLSQRLKQRIHNVDSNNLLNI